MAQTKKAYRGKKITTVPNLGVEEVSPKAIVRVPVSYVLHFLYSPKPNRNKRKGNNALPLMALLVPDPNWKDYITINAPQREVNVYIAHSLEDNDRYLRLAAVESTPEALLRIYPDITTPCEYHFGMDHKLRDFKLQQGKMWKHEVLCPLETLLQAKGVRVI